MPVPPFPALLLAVLVGGLPLAAAAQAPVRVPTPEEAAQRARMEKRFPQPVRVGDLIGLPLLDERLSTVGRVRDVVRHADGRTWLVLPYGGLFGLDARSIRLPLENAGMLGPQVVALDFPRDAFDKAPTWYGDDAVHPVDRNEVLRVALAQR